MVEEKEAAAEAVCHRRATCALIALAREGGWEMGVEEGVPPLPNARFHSHPDMHSGLRRDPQRETQRGLAGEMPGNPRVTVTAATAGYGNSGQRAAGRADSGQRGSGKREEQRQR